MEIGRIERNPDAPKSAPPPRGGRELEREAAERLDEIRQYFKDLYARRDVIARTTTSYGEDLDWVPSEADAEPPELEYAKRPGNADRPTSPQPFEVAAGNAEKGPPGTVPVIRKQLDSITATGTLQDYLAKGSRAKVVTPPDDPGVAPAAVSPHKYAHVIQQVTNYGTEGFINTWRPFVEWSDEFSLGQEWVVRGSFAPGTTDGQTVEVGAQTYKGLYGDWSPHLFIFYTTNNYTASGPKKGGYNTDVLGWKQASTTVYPTMRLAESVYFGSQYDLGIKVTLFNGNWWVRIGNEWMGYYPAGGPDGLFNAAGLLNSAQSIDWGGEVVDEIGHPGPTRTQMGSGYFPFEGWTRAAYVRNLAYQSDTSGTMVPMHGYIHETNPNAYRIVVDFSGTTTWGSNCYWGGPGGVE
ncbi:neprosin family prolyl endopeptidase [Streptomyces sp. E-08]|uniref:neprosin family prolyl endopeptidase n=1 Tax=Streptomyces sp. E-08 TaxID=3404047 RepID=UPI003CEE1EFD